MGRAQAASGHGCGERVRLLSSSRRSGERQWVRGVARLARLDGALGWLV